MSRDIFGVLGHSSSSSARHFSSSCSDLHRRQKTPHQMTPNPVAIACLSKLSKRGSRGENEERKRDYYTSSKRRIRSIYKASRDFAPVHRASTSRHNLASLQMKRALHVASLDDAYARLVFYVAIGWISLPFSG